MHKPLEPCDFHTWAAATTLHLSGSGTADGTGVDDCVGARLQSKTRRLQLMSSASHRCAQQSMLMQHGTSKAATTPCCAPGRASLPSGLFARGSCAPRGANAGMACRARRGSSAWLRCLAMCGVFLWNPVGAGEARAGHSLRVSRWPRGALAAWSPTGVLASLCFLWGLGQFWGRPAPSPPGCRKGGFVWVSAVCLGSLGGWHKEGFRKPCKVWRGQRGP